MKKLVSLFFIIITVFVLSLVALLLMVNPNNYKAALEKVVQEKTGYELTIKGELRWHIWPTISLLSNDIIVKQPSSPTPLLTADNIRFDVGVWSLLQHRLDIKNALINSAVVTLDGTSSSHAIAPKNVAKPKDVAEKKEAIENLTHWFNTLQKLEVKNSIVIIDQGKRKLNFRDVELKIDASHLQDMHFTASGRLNHNPYELSYTLHGDIKLEDTKNVLIDIKNGQYQLDVIQLVNNPMKGQLSAQISYQPKLNAAEIKVNTFTLNENKLNGDILIKQGNKPELTATLFSPHLSLPSFPKAQNNQSVTGEKSEEQVSVSRDIVRENLAFLDKFNGKLSLFVEELTIGHVLLNKTTIKAINEKNNTIIKMLDADMAGGHVNLHGQLDYTKPELKLILNANNLDTENLSELLAITSNVKGRLNIDGIFNSNLNGRFFKTLSGELQVSSANVLFKNINIDEIIQSAINRYVKDSVIINKDGLISDFKNMLVKMTLDSGKLAVHSIKANSVSIDVEGNGQMDLLQESADLFLKVTLLQGWNIDHEVIKTLQKIKIPLHIYGDVNYLKYDIDIHSLLSNTVGNQITQKVQKELNQVLNKIKKRERKLSSNDNTEKEQIRENVKDLFYQLKNKLNEDE